MIMAQMGQGCVRSDIYQLHFYDSLIFKSGTVIYITVCFVNVH